MSWFSTRMTGASIRSTAPGTPSSRRRTSMRSLRRVCVLHKTVSPPRSAESAAPRFSPANGCLVMEIKSSSRSKPRRKKLTPACFAITATGLDMSASGTTENFLPQPQSMKLYNDKPVPERWILLCRQRLLRTCLCQNKQASAARK